MKDSISIGTPYPKHLSAASYTYSYAPNDALISDGTTGYSADGAGNIIAAGATAYSFSVDNLLLAAGSATYGYDASGIRVSKGQGGQTTIYVSDLSGGLTEVLQERDSSTGAIKASYIYGLGLIARIDSTGNILYYHFDGQHNTVALSNDSGRVTDTYAYEPFGKMLKHTGSSRQPYAFLGMYGVQQETPSLYYMRARYYDAGNHRFLSTDAYPATLHNPQTLNRYVYALNDPVSKLDPSGLCSEENNANSNLENWIKAGENAWNNIDQGSSFIDKYWTIIQSPALLNKNYEAIVDLVDKSKVVKVMGVFTDIIGLIDNLTQINNDSKEGNIGGAVWNFTELVGTLVFLTGGGEEIELIWNLGAVVGDQLIDKK